MEILRELESHLANGTGELDSAHPKTIVYGVFKAMGDFLSAAPVILSELEAGNHVVLLTFPALQSFVDLVDFGPGRDRLELVALPVAGASSAKQFLSRMRQISPNRIWVSPHAPAPAASWKIPLILWLLKRLFWQNAVLAGAQSEPLSKLFDLRVPVDRRLPLGLREWTGYATARAQGGCIGSAPKIRFKPFVAPEASEPPAYDLLIHPGAGAQNRKWPFARYAEFVRFIPKTCRIAVLGLPEDVREMRHVLGEDREIAYLTGTIQESIASISRARVMLSMDSGNMFFAQILGVRTIALFGASAPANILPMHSVVSTIYEQRFACQPCGRSRCTQSEAFCVTSVSPERVAQDVLKALANEDDSRLQEITSRPG